MKDNSEANNNNDNSNGVGNNNLVDALEEPKEKYLHLVMSTLSTERYIILDDETSLFLNSLKTQFLGRKWIHGRESFISAIKNGSVPEIPKLGKPIDGFTLLSCPLFTLEGLIGECGLPFEKQLTETDMNKHQGRLLIAQDLVEKFVKPLMSEEERRSLTCGEEIQVTAYGLNGIEYPMKFKFWATKMHVLTSGWNEFRIDSEFKALQDWVTIWVIRHKRTGKLCFGMIARTFPTNQLIKPQKKKKGEETNK